MYFTCGWLCLGDWISEWILCSWLVNIPGKHVSRLKYSRSCLSALQNCGSNTCLIHVLSWIWMWLNLSLELSNLINVGKHMNWSHLDMCVLFNHHVDTFCIYWFKWSIDLSENQYQRAYRVYTVNMHCGSMNWLRIRTFSSTLIQEFLSHKAFRFQIQIQNTEYRYRI